MADTPTWFAIHPEVATVPGALVTAGYPFDGHVDLFVTGTDGAVWSTFFQAGGGWQPWFLIHPEIKMAPGATVTALYPFDGHVDLFVTGTDGAVWSTFFEADGGWRPWFLIHPEIKMAVGAPICAQLSIEGHVDLFVTGTDGAVWSSWYEADPGWAPWFIVARGYAEPKAPITATTDNFESIAVYARMGDSAIRLAVFGKGDGWSDWEPIRNEMAWPTDATVATAYGYLYAIDGNGTAHVTWYVPTPTSYEYSDGSPAGWQEWQPLPAPVPLNAQSTLTAGLVEWPDHDDQGRGIRVVHVDLFATARDGTVWSMGYEPLTVTFNDGNEGAPQPQGPQ